MPSDTTIRLAGTLPALLAQRAARSPRGIAFRVPHAGPPFPGSVPGAAQASRTVTWAEHSADVDALARSLARLGVACGDRVGILAPTSVRWEAAQMAVLARGALAVGLDANYPDSELCRLVETAGLSALFVQDDALAHRVAGALRDDAVIVCFDAGGTGDGAAGNGMGSLDRPVHAFDGLLEQGRALPAPDAGGPLPDSDAIMVFSSGTTGHPKPIVYTHRQMLEAVDALVDAFPDLDERARLLCWLPLANLFQRMIDFCAIALGASSYVIDDPRTVMAHLPAAAPHLFIGVPRFFERVHAGIRERLDAAPAPVRLLARQALDAGARAARARQAGRIGPLAALQARVLDALVLRRLRAMFGANARHLLSGSAPMAPWLLEFYDAIGLTVYEAYGVSENVVPIAMNRPGQRRLGTVGRPLPGNEVVLADDGEIRVRGAGVFGRYWSAPPDAPRPDAQGFWSTGDLGAFDADGFLRISGRKADAFKLSTGRWVAPAEIENRLRRVPPVDHAIVIGAARKAVVAVVAVEPAALPADDAARAELAVTLARDLTDATTDLPDYQRPAAILVATAGFSIQSGDLTANLKIRRRAIADKLADPIEAVYRGLDNKPAAPASGRAFLLPVHFT